MTRTSVTVTTEIDLDTKTAAKWFCGLNDEDQAQFLIDVQAESLSWDGDPHSQWYYMTGHLNECACSNQATRDMLSYWGERVSLPLSGRGVG